MLLMDRMDQRIKVIKVIIILTHFKKRKLYLNLNIQYAFIEYILFSSLVLDFGKYRGLCWNNKTSTICLTMRYFNFTQISSFSAQCGNGTLKKLRTLKKNSKCAKFGTKSTHFDNVFKVH